MQKNTKVLQIEKNRFFLQNAIQAIVSTYEDGKPICCLRIEGGNTVEEAVSAALSTRKMPDYIILQNGNVIGCPKDRAKAIALCVDRFKF